MSTASRETRGGGAAIVQLLPWIGVAAIVTWRLAALSGRGDPVGVDVGNWVRIGRSWTGDVDVADAVYPPFVPAVATGIEALIGPLWTSRLLQATAGAAPGLGVWWVLRARVRPGWAIGAALAVAMTAATSAAVAWGGVPQLIGLGLFPIAVDRVRRWAADPVSSRAWQPGMTIAATGLVSTLVFGLTVIAAFAAAVIAAIAARSSRSRIPARRWGKGIAVMVTPLVVLLPWYIPILGGQRLPDDRVSSLRGGSAIDDVLGWPVAVWFLLIVLSFVGVMIARTAVGTWWATMAGCWVTMVVAVAATETRLLYVVPTCAALGVGSIGAHRSPAGTHPSEVPHGHTRAARGTPAVRGRQDRVASMQRWSSGPLSVGVIVVAAFAPSQLDEQISYYSQFTPHGTVAATEWLAAQAGPDDVVLAAPVEGVPTGWWVEAAGVDAWVASRPDWLFFPGERSEAARAAALLSGAGWPSETSVAALRDCGVRWLYLPTGWGGIDADALARATSAGHLEVAFDGPGAMILRVLTDGDLPDTGAACPSA